MGITVSVSHAFVATIPEDTSDDAGIVGPNAWNAAHSVSASADFTPEEAQDAGLQGLPEVREATGTITVDADTDDHILCGTGACTVNLPASADRHEGRAIKVVDYGLDADTNTKTIEPDGVETIMGLDQYLINFRGGSVELWPRPDGTGWYV